MIPNLPLSFLFLMHHHFHPSHIKEEMKMAPYRDHERCSKSASNERLIFSLIRSRQGVTAWFLPSPPISSPRGRRQPWQPRVYLARSAPAPATVAGCRGKRARGCDTSFELIGISVSELCWCLRGRTRANTLSRGGFVFFFFLVVAFSQPGGQMLQEYHSWPKAAGGKRHPPPAGLRPPSAREGGGGGVLPLQHQKGIGVLRKHPRERWILLAADTSTRSGARGATGTTFGSSLPWEQRWEQTAPDGMNPARRAVSGPTAFPEKFPFSF